MESSILIIVAFIVVVWYFGRVINNTVAGASEMASVEFEMLKDEQSVRIAKQYSDLGNRLEKVLNEATHTKGSVKKLIKGMQIHQEEEN